MKEKFTFELENKYDLDTADGRKAVEDILDSQLKAEYTNEKHAELIENAKKALKDQGIEDPSEEQIIKQVRKDLNLSPDGPDKDILSDTAPPRSPHFRSF